MFCDLCTCTVCDGEHVCKRKCSNRNVPVLKVIMTTWHQLMVVTCLCHVYTHSTFVSPSLLSFLSLYLSAGSNFLQRGRLQIFSRRPFSTFFQEQCWNLSTISSTTSVSCRYCTMNIQTYVVHVKSSLQVTVHVYVMRKVQIRTIRGLSCANLGSELCKDNPWIGQVLTHALLPVWFVYTD